MNEGFPIDALTDATWRALLLENAERSLREAHPELKQITFAGDLRRGCELVADISLVAEASRAGRGIGNAHPGRRALQSI